MSARTWKLAILSVAMATSMFGGQSLTLQPGTFSSLVNDPNFAANQPWRVEFQLHNWQTPGAASGEALLWRMSGIGAEASIQTNGVLRVMDDAEMMSSSVCDMPVQGRTNILVRIQRDPILKKFSCEFWNVDGTGHYLSSLTLLTVGAGAHTGGMFGGWSTVAQLGFYRVFGTVIPEGGCPPYTFTSETTIASYSFDGNTLDASGNGYTFDFPGATYATTPNQNPAAVARTVGSPAWSNWVSLRAGFPATLDAGSSFSMADGSNALAYAWTQTSGPTTLVWTGANTANPVVKGLVFGTYSFSLKVTDVAGRSASTNVTLGAVATDDNGVVVQANPAADKIFGPMIAFGKNPWPWADQMALHSAEVRSPQLSTISPPTWSSNLQGTVSYTPSSASAVNQTTLSTTLTADSLTINIADATKLDFSTLPTMIIVHTPGVWQPIEEIRICGASRSLLTVCYDGRAWRAGQWQHAATAQTWPAGSSVRQVMTTGTGSRFLTDFCPAGLGQGGTVNYAAGSVSAIPGSTALTGNGTAWNSNMEGLVVRIQGTHAGKSFVYFAIANDVTNGTTMTLSRPWPADADIASGLKYSILNSPANLVRGWKRPDGTAGRDSIGVSSCESNTRIYHDEIFSNVQGAQTNQTLSSQTATWLSEFGPNYYDEVLAHYAGYLRSGYSLFQNNARMVGDYWATAPDFDEGWTGVTPRRVGATGMVASAVLDGRTKNWPAIRNLANGAIAAVYSGGAILPTCDADTRESAYGLSWIALAAMFDPNDTGDPNTLNQKSYWQAQLTKALARDQGCKGPNNEFPQANWPAGASFALTQGSTTAKGSGVPQSICPVVSTGTISVTNGLQFASGTGIVQNAKIVVMGKRGGMPYLFYSQFTATSASSATLFSPYDGDSGTYPFQIESDYGWLAFAADGTDHANMNVLYACQWIDANTIQLDRPWQAATGTYSSARGTEVGYGEQPFILGIKTLAMKYASLGATGATATGYAGLAAGTANWIMTTGFDPATGGLNYFRGLGGCEPKLNPRLNCTYATDNASKSVARTLNGEAQNAVRVAYEANPTAANKAFGDQFYGAQWGKLGGPYSDGVYLSALENDATWNYKWMGFLFGIGMAHQWPAVRLGGVMPAAIVTKQVAVKLPGNATAAQVLVTQPSGATQTFACTGTTCQFTADARQGAHWYQVQYLSSSKAVVSSDKAVLVETR